LFNYDINHTAPGQRGEWVKRHNHNSAMAISRLTEGC
jgi:hypothetical protein